MEKKLNFEIHFTEFTEGESCIRMSEREAMLTTYWRAGCVTRDGARIAGGCFRHEAEARATAKNVADKFGWEPFVMSYQV